MNAQSSKPMQGGSMDNVHNLTPEQDIEQQAADWLLRLAAEQDDEQAQELLTYFEKNEDGFSRKSLDAANREG